MARTNGRESATQRYLDLLRQRLQLPSDYALADVLGVTTQAIYKLRGGGVMSATTAARAAELLALNPLEVIADVELERGSDSALWKRVRSAAAVLAGAAIAAAGAPQDARAAFDLTQRCAATTGSGQAPHIPGRNATGVIHIVRHRRRSLGEALAALLAWLGAVGVLQAL